MDQARGPVLQRPLQVEDSIQFLHQRIQECNACLPYTGTSHQYLTQNSKGVTCVSLAALDMQQTNSPVRTCLTYT